MQVSRCYSVVLQMISVLVGKVLVMVSDFAIIPPSLAINMDGEMHPAAGCAGTRTCLLVWELDLQLIFQTHLGLNRS